MHVLAGGQHVRVADRVTARAGGDVLAVQGADKAAEFVVGHHLKYDGEVVLSLTVIDVLVGGGVARGWIGTFNAVGLGLELLKQEPN